MPWFTEHCRFLSEAERIVRRINDPAAFVCDGSPGRPKGLTSKYVLAHSQAPDGMSGFQEFANENHFCAEHDASERISLDLSDPTPTRRLEVLCYDSPSPKCEKFRK